MMCYTLRFVLHISGIQIYQFTSCYFNLWLQPIDVPTLSILREVAPPVRQVMLETGLEKLWKYSGL